jgi:hypothetical protein
MGPSREVLNQRVAGMRGNSARQTYFVVNIISVIGRTVKHFLPSFLLFLWISTPSSSYFPGWRGGCASRAHC